MDFKNNKLLICILIVLTVSAAKIYTDSNLSYETLGINSPVHETSDKSSTANNEAIQKDAEILLSENEPTQIYVHVAGRVKSPGLVKLENGSRVIDAVQACGGMYDDADMNNINLAKKLSDEDRVYIPSINENKEVQNFVSETSKININSSSKEELMNLPNVGEKTADSIIKYREKTQFKKIEDIMNVPGIGEKTFESLKDSIDV